MSVGYEQSASLGTGVLERSEAKPVHFTRLQAVPSHTEATIEPADTATWRTEDEAEKDRQLGVERVAKALIVLKAGSRIKLNAAVIVRALKGMRFGIGFDAQTWADSVELKIRRAHRLCGQCSPAFGTQQQTCKHVGKFMRLAGLRLVAANAREVVDRESVQRGSAMIRIAMAPADRRTMKARREEANRWLAETRTDRKSIPNTVEYDDGWKLVYRAFAEDGELTRRYLMRED